MKKHLNIAIGGDHGGFEMKQALAAYALTKGHKVQDCGTHGTAPVDYPDIAKAVAELVASGRCDVGVIVDGAGIGSAMAANKVPGVLAAACYNVALANNCREHNGANVLTLGSGQTSLADARRILDVFLTTDCTEDRHQKRIDKILAIESCGVAAGAAAGAAAGLSSSISAQDMQRINQRVAELSGGSGAASFASPSASNGELDSAAIAQYVDHTVLKPEASRADVIKLCEEAREFQFFSVCVNPSYAREAKKALAGCKVKVCCVVGFPLGAQPPESKAMEARRAIREGAKEIDMVINVGAVKSGDEDYLLHDIRTVVEACRDGSALLKVILETSLLTDTEKQRVCELCMQAGADYVKTSTGFGSAGATIEDISLMARTVASKKLGVKASGGVKTYDDALAMIKAGATRIGTSSGIAIVQEARKRTGR